jgi:hypothetical protein
MSTINLPVELYRPIFKELGQKDLISLLLVSRTFQLESEKLLYLKTSLRSQKQTVLWCFQVLSKSRLFESVHHLYISFSYQPARSPTIAFGRLLTSILHRLPNLLTLKLSGRDLWWRFCDKNLVYCPFKLRSLQCQFQFDSNFSSFLESQPAIVELQLSTGPHARPLQPHYHSVIPPNTKVLSLYMFHSIDAKILWNRPVTHLRWKAMGYMPPFATFATPAKSNFSLRYLHIHHGAFGDHEVWRLLPDHLPRLEYLGVINYDWRPNVSYFGA